MTRTESLPPVANLPWTSAMKPLDSAKTSVEVLADGRLHLTIEHDVLRGVTPEMLDYWFRHIEGELVVEGERVSRYSAWHPRDHVAYAAWPSAEGTIGRGSVFRIHEVLGRNPAHEVDVLTDVTRLDRGGFAHRPRLALGLPLARMDYTFAAVSGGTLYRNSMTIGLEGGAAARAFNRYVRPRMFSDAKVRAWLLHNEEEVGNLEHFVPALVALADPRATRARAESGHDVRRAE